VRFRQQRALDPVGVELGGRQQRAEFVVQFAGLIEFLGFPYVGQIGRETVNFRTMAYFSSSRSFSASSISCSLSCSFCFFCFWEMAVTNSSSEAMASRPMWYGRS